MILRIARKELIECARDGRFRWAAGILFALLLFSLLVGWRHYREVQAQRAVVARAERERWLNQGEKNPHSAAHFGAYALKPQMPLSAVDQGVDPYAGTSVFLEAHNYNLFQYKPAADATAVARFGALTAAVTLQLLIPLLIILLLFPAFAGEREQGTLRQLLSLGVKRSELALGKAVGAAAPLALLLVPAVLVGVISLALYSDTAASRNTLPRLVMMVLGYLMYFGIFIGLAIIASAWASSSRQALMILLAFWFINCLMLPPVATDIARAIYPTPAALSFRSALAEETRQSHSLWERNFAVEQRLLKQYGVDSADKLPINPAGVALMEAEEEGDRIQEEHFNRLYDAYDKQNRLYELGALAAPMIAVQSLSMGLAGTDYAQHLHFARAAEAYRREFVQMLNRDDALNGKMPSIGVVPSYRAGRGLWERVPPFRYTPPSLGWVVGNHRLGLALLALWFVAVTAALPVFVTKVRID